MKIATIHYHARPGGITRVIEQSIQGLADRAHCLFFSGEAARSVTPIQKRIRVLPQLAYSAQTKPQPLDMLRLARGAFGTPPDIWHIHNHGLGKNLALTQEITNLAMMGQKILLHIHDFAEDGYPENYKNLKKLAKRLYPVAAHIHYAVLNQRDFSILSDAGIPVSNLHLLPNAASPIPAVPKVSSDEDPLYVYPCRAIRRKNIGELLLWSAVMPDARFAISLADNTPDGKAEYKEWVAFAEELGLRVEFNAGADTTAHDMMTQADAIITTSTSENFGLSFLEPWLANKPLVGRNLPEITADIAENGIDLSQLYNRLGVPLTTTDWNIGPDFLEALEDTICATNDAFGRPWSDEEFEAAQAALIQEGTVDFGLLDEAMQRTIIRAAQQAPEMFAGGLGSITEGTASNRAVAEKCYSVEAYADRLEAVYKTLMAIKPGTVRYADSNAVLEAFISPERITRLD